MAVLLGQGPEEEDDSPLPPLDVAALLVGWLRTIPQDCDLGSAFLQAQVDALAWVYRQSDAEGRIRIETFLVEHVLEDVRMERFFSGWPDDSVLGPGYRLSLDWGRSHRNTPQ